MLTSPTLSLADRVAAMARCQERGDLPCAADFATQICALTTGPASTEEVQARASALAVLGVAAYEAGRWGEATDRFCEALALLPAVAEWRRMLSFVLLEMRWFDRAQDEIARAVAFDPTNPLIRVAQGVIALRCGVAETAHEAFTEAVQISDRDPESLVALAAYEGDLGNFDVAIRLCEEARASCEPYIDADHVQGCALLRQMKIADAIPLMAKSAADGNAAAEYNLGYAEMLLGHYADGFRHMEARFRAGLGSGRELKRFGRPMWDGHRMGRLHVHFEQGLGDAIMFARWLPVLVELGNDVRLEVPETLVCLFARSFPDVAVMPQPIDYPGVYGIPDFDFHCPLMSIPHLLGVQSAAEFPLPPYLKPADNDSVFFLQPGPKVGICWTGGSNKQSGLWVEECSRRRSINPELFWSLREAGVSFISLLPRNDGQATETGLPIWQEDYPSFDETASVIASLDLVISVDTAVAHLAGALGKSVWLLDRYDHCWRWLAGREDTPWYPTMRIFRQDSPGDWGGVLRRVAIHLSVITEIGV